MGCLRYVGSGKAGYPRPRYVSVRFAALQRYAAFAAALSSPSRHDRPPSTPLGRRASPADSHDVACGSAAAARNRSGSTNGSVPGARLPRPALPARREELAHAVLDSGHPQRGPRRPPRRRQDQERSEEHTSELQSLMRTSYAVLCLQKKNQKFTNCHDHRTSSAPNQKTHIQKQHQLLMIRPNPCTNIESNNTKT